MSRPTVQRTAQRTAPRTARTCSRRTLLERLLGCRLVWRQAAMSRIISFEYLNRQLVRGGRGGAGR